MFEFIRKAAHNHPLTIKYSDTLKAFTVVLKNVAIFYVGELEECEEFVQGYNDYVTSFHHKLMKVS